MLICNCRFPYDPILQLRPPFARSLPVQVLLNGIVLSLSSVLLIQLLFTAQYHWPLAPLNFTLQVAAVILLVVTSVVTIFIVLSTVTAESRTWPYMLNYLAVDIPPSMNTNWPTPDLVAWLLMTATTAGLIQVSHLLHNAFHRGTTSRHDIYLDDPQLACTFTKDYLFGLA